MFNNISILCISVCSRKIKIRKEPLKFFLLSLFFPIIEYPGVYRKYSIFQINKFIQSVHQKYLEMFIKIIKIRQIISFNRNIMFCGSLCIRALNNVENEIFWEKKTVCFVFREIYFHFLLDCCFWNKKQREIEKLQKNLSEFGHFSLKIRYIIELICDGCSQGQHI